MLDFCVLGRFEVRRDGVPIDLGGARRRAFLALLVLNAGRVLGAERLIDALWRERPPRTANHVLHVYASELRKRLVADVLVTRPHGYALEVSGDAIDLVRFERLVEAGRVALAAGDADAAAATVDEAIGLWRGPMLEDLAYEDFVQPEARRLEELQLAARELRAQVGLMLGVDAEFVASLRALAEQNPLREPTHALLMRALAASGRQAEALAVYDTLRRRLDSELGIDPGAELRAVHTAVLRQEVAPAVTAAARTSSVLAVAFSPERLRAVAFAADAVAAGSGREVIVACIHDRRIDSRPDLATCAHAAAEARSAVRSPSRSAAFASSDLAGDIAAFAAEHDSDLVLVDADGAIPANGRLPELLRGILESVTADVALLIGEAPPPAAVMAAPFGGGVHDWAATELAALIARGQGGGLRLIGITTDHDDASRLVARAALAVQRGVGLDADPVLAAPGADGLLVAASGCGCLVLGVSDRWHSDGLGAVRAAIMAAAPRVLIVRRGLRPGLLAPPVAHTRFTWSIAG